MSSEMNSSLIDDTGHMSESVGEGGDIRELLEQEYEDWNTTEEAVDLAVLAKIVPVVVPILFTMAIIIGFIGNLLVVLVVLTNKTMRSTTNILILNLAVSDLLFVVLCMPFTAIDYALTSAWPFGNVWCKLDQFLIYLNFFVSVYTLVCMSLDRFLAVVFPVQSISIRTEGHAVRLMFVLWLVFIIGCIPMLSIFGLKHFPEPGTNSSVAMCVFMENATLPGLGDVTWNQLNFQIGFFVFGYLLPLILITILYSLMLNRLWKKAPGGRNNNEAQSRSKKRVVKLIIIVIAIFAICWLPLQVILLLKPLKLFQVNIPSISIQIASHVLAYSNSCVNPILYAFFSPQFRKAFYDFMFHGRKAGERNNRQQFDKPEKPKKVNGMELLKPNNNTNETKVSPGSEGSSEHKAPNIPSPAEQPCKIIVHQQNKILPAEMTPLKQEADLYPNYSNPSFTDSDKQEVKNIPALNGINHDVNNLKDENEDVSSNNNSSNDTTIELDNLACSTNDEKVLNNNEDTENGSAIDVATEHINGTTQAEETNKQVNLLSNLSLKKSKSSSCSSLDNVIMSTSNYDKSCRLKDDIVPDQLTFKDENQLMCKDDIDAEQLTSLLNNLAGATSGENFRDSKDFLIIFPDEKRVGCDNNSSSYVAVEECVQCI